VKIDVGTRCDAWPRMLIHRPELEAEDADGQHFDRM
jgi:hypothetical protein